MVKNYPTILTIALLTLGACKINQQATKENRPYAGIKPIMAKPFSIDGIHQEFKTQNYYEFTKVVNPKENYQTAYKELESMLKGEIKADFERAVFISENPYHNNAYAYEAFQRNINWHLVFIESLIKANDKSDSMEFNAKVGANGRFKMSDIRYMPEQKKELYRKALSNWAVFTYLTDTTALFPFYNLPYTYSTQDPFGKKDWSNSQVIGLLTSEEQKGNCYAMTAFYKILADRLQAGARLCTAPQHIYIQHQDPKGHYYNVELATAGHPGDGTIQTLTHTTTEGIMSGIALRSYDERQSIGLCLVNLAKSYEHKFKTKDDEFMLQCAELVLQYDELNLNALLLKQQVLDARITGYAKTNNIEDIKTLKRDSRINKTMMDLERHTAKLYELGYRQMPYDMQQIIMTGIYPENFKDKNPSPFTSFTPPDEHRQHYQSLYGGLFVEVFETKAEETYGSFTYDTKSKTITKLNRSTESQNTQLIDPVAFAYDFGARIYDARLGRWLSTDPLQAKYPSMSPYVGVGNNPVIYVDRDGRDFILSDFFAKSLYFQPLLNMISYNKSMGKAGNYIREYLKTGNDLTLRYFDFDNQVIDGEVLSSESAANTKLEGNKDATIRFNSNMALSVVTEGKDDNQTTNVRRKKEIGAVNVILHEMILHAARENGDHEISSDLFLDLVSGLQSYSKEVMKKVLSFQDAVAIGIQGVGEDVYKQLQQNEAYKNQLTLTYDEAVKHGKSLSNEIDDNFKSGDYNNKSKSDNSPINQRINEND